MPVVPPMIEEKKPERAKAKPVELPVAKPEEEPTAKPKEDLPPKIEPELPTTLKLNGLKVGQKGKLPDDGTSYSVQRILGDDTLSVAPRGWVMEADVRRNIAVKKRVDGRPFVVKGIETKSFVDGASIKLSQVFEVGTYRDKSGKTVFMLTVAP